VSLLLATLEGLPAAPAGARVAAQCRSLAQTPAGRAQIARFAGRVADLLGEAEAHRVAARAAAAAETGSWQAAFEAGGDAENQLAHALWHALPPLTFTDAAQYQGEQGSRAAQVAERCARLLAVARA
jgi:hypothetical protein